MNWNNFEFLHPQFLWLLVLIPFLVIWYFLIRKEDSAALIISSTKGFEVKPSIWAKLKPLLYILRLLAIALLIVAMARPRTVSISQNTKTNKGIDIVMAIDVSASMLARDLKPNRLEALKVVASEFVNQRTNDRVGIVVFAALGDDFRALGVNRVKHAKSLRFSGSHRWRLSCLEWFRCQTPNARGRP